MENQTFQKRVYSVSEFRHAFSVSNTSFYALVKAGQLKTIKIGRRTLVCRDEAERWFQTLPSGAILARRAGGVH